MRKEYGKSLRKLFSRRMKESLSEFQEEKINSTYINTGERAFSWVVNDSVRCWIVLSPSQKYDEFTVLLGWSVLNRYPELSMIPSSVLPNNSQNEFRLDEYMTRLPFLWSKADKWWVIKEFKGSFSVEEIMESMKPISTAEADSEVLPLVDDTIDKLITIGIPYLKDFVNNRVISIG